MRSIRESIYSGCDDLSKFHFMPILQVNYEILPGIMAPDFKYSKIISLHISVFNFNSQLLNQFPRGLLGQLVKQGQCNHKVMGSNPIQVWIFSGLLTTT